MKKTQQKALSYFYNVVLDKLPHFGHWLLIGNDVWQADTRVVRYRKLWSSFSYQELYLPDGERSEEYMIQSANGLKFFGAIESNTFDFTELVELIRHERACILVAADRRTFGGVVTHLLARGWTRGGFPPPLEILQLACDTPMLVYHLLGEFDDVESGAVIIGQRKLIQSCFEST